jgi:hypothetical protein
MTPQYFRRGEPIAADKLNALVDGVLANRLQPGRGYVVTNTSRGTSLNITATGGGAVGGAAAFCPFEVTTANVSPSEWKFKVEFGLIGGKMPTGMYPGGIPPLIMDWVDGWVLAYVEFVTDGVAVQSVNIVVNADIPANTDVGAYYPLAYIFTDSTDPENPVQVIQNLCSQPVPSVCDLAFTAP